MRIRRRQPKKAQVSKQVSKNTSGDLDTAGEGGRGVVRDSVE